MALSENITRHRVPLRTLDTHFQLEEARMINRYYGKPGRRLFFDLNKLPQASDGREELLGRYDLEEMDRHFFATLREDFGLREGEEVEFYRKQLNRANKTVRYLISKLNLPIDQYDLRNEVALFPDSPSERLLLMGDVNGVGETLRFEVARQMLLALAITPLDLRAATDKLGTNLSILNSFLNRSLYADKVGETDSATVFSEHDNTTNEVTRYLLGQPFDPSPTHHIKQTGFRVRNTVFGQQVVTHIRHKGENESLIKALEKALHNDKPIDVLDSVHDSIGMQFIIMGDKRDRDQFVDQFEELVRTKYQNIEKLEPDDSPDDGRGQRKSVFERRTQMRVKGLSVPVEVIYFSLGEYLNQMYEVGVEGNGRAHELYELRRLGHSVTHLFPEEIYGSEIQGFIEEQKRATAVKLSFMNNYTPQPSS